MSKIHRKWKYLVDLNRCEWSEQNHLKLELISLVNVVGLMEDSTDARADQRFMVLILKLLVGSVVREMMNAYGGFRRVIVIDDSSDIFAQRKNAGECVWPGK